MAVVTHAVCHADVYRMANTEITADFPGAAKAFVENSFGGRTVALFLQGCAWDVHPNLPGSGAGYTNNTADFGRSGNDVDMAWCGWSLGAEVVKVAAKARVREQVRAGRSGDDIAGAAAMLKISADPGRLRSNTRNQVIGGKIDFPVRALRIGDLWFVRLPGEPVVEYELQIEARMIREGGYEVDGGACSKASQREILDGVQALITRLEPSQQPAGDPRSSPIAEWLARTYQERSTAPAHLLALPMLDRVRSAPGPKARFAAYRRARERQVSGPISPA